MPAKKPQIVVLEGYPLQNFMEMLTGSRNLPGSLYRLRIRPTAKGFGMEFKVNEGEWTAPMGHSDLREQFGTASHEAMEAAAEMQRADTTVPELHTNPWDVEIPLDTPEAYAKTRSTHGLDTNSGYADRLRGDSKGGFH